VAYYLDQNRYILVHGTSLTIFEGLPDQASVAPNLAFRFNTQSTFQKKGNLFESDYNQNSLILDLKILKSLRSQGEANVYYRVKKSQAKWRELNDPYGTIIIERLPIGTDYIELYVQNEIGINSPMYQIPFRVLPPFYLATWFIVLSAIVLILLIILIVLWRVKVTQKISVEKLRKKQLEARALTAELTAIRSQMNPHFIFNVLTAIQAKVIEGKTDEAYQNIGDFAELIRNVLDKSGKEHIFLKEEIALMENYVELENSRLPSPISFHVELDDPDYFDEVLIPTLITQPIIENAIKHAFPRDKANKQIILTANRNANGFALQIVDNGVGMDAAAEQKSHQSFALIAIKKRVLTLSEQGSFQIDLTFETSKNGTCVTFTFNYK
jgi:signal transduction histidine kinase